MKERNLQTAFNKYLQNRWSGSAAFELKICHEKSMPFDAVKEHQIHALQVAKHSLLAYKISDFSPEVKPFDCLVLDNVPAYVVIMYYERGVNSVYLIDIDDFVREKETSIRKSLTPKRASEIGKLIVLA